jgi:hypothetical protein
MFFGDVRQNLCRLRRDLACTILRKNTFRQAEIKNLGVPPLGDENVGGFDITMNDAFAVRSIERVGNLEAAQAMLTRFAQWQGRKPESVAADTTYGNGEFLQWLAEREITPYMRTRDSIHRKNSPFYGPERFTYQPEHNRHICPAGQVLNYGGRNLRNRTYAYIGTRKRCGGCALKAQCTSGAFRFLAIHMDEAARQRARELANTPEFAQAQRQRKKVEALFAELKNQIGLRRLRLRRLKFVREQFFLAATAQNLKRLVRFLSQAATPTVEAAA